VFGTRCCCTDTDDDDDDDEGDDVLFLAVDEKEKRIFELKIKNKFSQINFFFCVLEEETIFRGENGENGFCVKCTRCYDRKSLFAKFSFIITIVFFL
jgi:hypothetical protein